MEYLITYGLALFVILIVLAILVAVVLPSLQAPETCQFTQPGFSCSTKKHALVYDTDDDVVKILFQLDNQQGKPIDLYGVHCSSVAPANIKKSDVRGLPEIDPQLPEYMQMAAGRSITVGGADADIEAQLVCKNEDGSNVVLAPGSNFRGSIAITYRFSEDLPGAPTRLAVATVTGTIQEQ